MYRFNFDSIGPSSVIYLPGAGGAVEGPAAEVVGVGGVAGHTRRRVLPLPAKRLLKRVPVMRPNHAT